MENVIHLVIITSRSTCFSLSLLTFDMAIENENETEITNKIRNNHNSTQFRLDTDHTFDVQKHTEFYSSVIESSKWNHKAKKANLTHASPARTFANRTNLCVFFAIMIDCSFFLCLILFEIKSLLFFILSNKSIKKDTLRMSHPFREKKKLAKKLNTMFIF